MNAALKNLMTRRSCRKYDPAKQVESDKLDMILAAGTYAPTGKGLQSPLIVAVQNKEEVAYVQKLNARVRGDETAATFYGAPTVVIVFGDKNSEFCLDDGNLVMANILNAANAVGVDSCYIWRAREAFSSEEGKALMKKWGVPDNYIGVGNVILGYGLDGGIREAKPRKDDYVIKIL
jgi:nitroreductase